MLSVRRKNERGAAVMVLVIVATLGITGYLVGTLVRSIQNGKRTTMRLWKKLQSRVLCVVLHQLGGSGGGRMAGVY